MKMIMPKQELMEDLDFTDIINKYSKSKKVDAVTFTQGYKVALIIFDSQEGVEDSPPSIMFQDGFLTFQKYSNFIAYLEDYFDTDSVDLATEIKPVSIEMKLTSVTWGD